MALVLAGDVTMPVTLLMMPPIPLPISRLFSSFNVRAVAASPWARCSVFSSLFAAATARLTCATSLGASCIVSIIDAARARVLSITRCTTSARMPWMSPGVTASSSSLRTERMRPRSVE